MTIRIRQPADGTSYVSFTWDSGQQILTEGQLIDVPPGSALESAIGVPNLVIPTSAQLTDAAAGGAGAVSN